MKQKAGTLLRIVAVGALLVAALPTLAGAAATFKDVVVRNTPEQPVPVAGEVAVNNLPATQAVSGQVAVNNLPAVQRTSSVADEQPFHGGADGFGGVRGVVIEDGEFSHTDSFVVPEGKRLMIRQVWVEANVPSEEQPLVVLDVFGGSATPQHMSFVASRARVNQWIVLEPLFMSATAGETVRMNVNRAPARVGEASYRWSINGYLVDA